MKTHSILHFTLSVAALSLALQSPSASAADTAKPTLKDVYKDHFQ